MIAKLQGVRNWVFRVSVIANIIAVLGVPFYERWFSRLGYAALASDKLHMWLGSMGAASLIAFVGSLFGRGAYRAVALIFATFELYFWFVLSIAV